VYPQITQPVLRIPPFRGYLYEVTDEADVTAGHSARREYERRLASRERERAAKKRSIIAALKGPSAEEKRQAERDDSGQSAPEAKRWWPDL